MREYRSSGTLPALSEIMNSSQNSFISSSCVNVSDSISQYSGDFEHCMVCPNISDSSSGSSFFVHNNELLERAKHGDPDAENELVRANMGLVRSIAARFRDHIGDHHGCDFEDLQQIGTIGMIKAIKSFDPSYGTAFSTYAVPLIIGELKRFFRDDGYLKISRTVKRTNAAILHEREKFISANAREPTVNELSELCGMTTEDLVFTMNSGRPLHSLNEAVDEDGDELGDLLPDQSDEIEALTDRLSLKDALRQLPTVQRQIVFLRYFRDLSQQETADLLGLTQVKISREEKRIFEKLRSLL